MIYLLIAIFAIGEQKSVLAKQRCMRFVTSDENAKGQGCNSIGILHLKLLWSLSSQQHQYATPSIVEHLTVVYRPTPGLPLL